MRILIEPPDHIAGAPHAGDEVRKALEILQAAYIKTEGGTITSDGTVTGVIVVSSDDDGSDALEALGKAGIRASIG
jgi:hypothetical protein